MVWRAVIAAAGVLGVSPATASAPSPILFGVERVVIACEADPGLSRRELDALCTQLVRKAQAVTALPVAIAGTRDRGPVSRQRMPKAQLMLRVSAESREIEKGRKALSLSVMPVRSVGGAQLKAPLKSIVSWVEVEDLWVVQGPVDAFTRLLAARPPRLRKPIRSDS